MNLRKQLIRTAAAWAVLVGFMMLFRPDHLPVVGLIVPFVLLFGGFYTSWMLAGMLRSRYFVREHEYRPHKHLGKAISATIVLLLVLQSLGQLTVRDVITVVATVTLGYLYLARSTFNLIKR